MFPYGVCQAGRADRRPAGEHALGTRVGEVILRVYSGRRVRDAPLLARLGTRLARVRRPARGSGRAPARPAHRARRLALTGYRRVTVSFPTGLTNEQNRVEGVA